MNTIVKVTAFLVFLTVLTASAFSFDPITVTPDGHILVNANGVAVDLIEYLVPVGSIQPFAGSTVPAGWALCDGSSVPRDGIYSRLFAVIDTAFGASDGGSFNLPDLRGRFIRGVDGDAEVDSDRTSRTALKVGGNTGNKVGSAQGYASARPVSSGFRGTTGTDYPDHVHTMQVCMSGPAGFSMAWTAQSANPVPTTDSTSGANTRHQHDFSVTAGGDSETRPINVYVNFIVKL